MQTSPTGREYFDTRSHRSKFLRARFLTLSIPPLELFPREHQAPLPHNELAHADFDSLLIIFLIELHPLQQLRICLGTIFPEFVLLSLSIARIYKAKVNLFLIPVAMAVTQSPSSLFVHGPLTAFSIC